MSNNLIMPDTLTLLADQALEFPNHPDVILPPNHVFSLATHVLTDQLTYYVYHGGSFEITLRRPDSCTHRVVLALLPIPQFVENSLGTLNHTLIRTAWNKRGALSQFHDTVRSPTPGQVGEVTLRSERNTFRAILTIALTWKKR